MIEVIRHTSVYSQLTKDSQSSNHSSSPMDNSSNFPIFPTPTNPTSKNQNQILAAENTNKLKKKPHKKEKNGSKFLFLITPLLDRFFAISCIFWQ